MFFLVYFDRFHFPHKQYFAVICVVGSYRGSLLTPRDDSDHCKLSSSSQSFLILWPPLWKVLCPNRNKITNFLTLKCKLKFFWSPIMLADNFVQSLLEFSRNCYGLAIPYFVSVSEFDYECNLSLYDLYVRSDNNILSHVRP